MKKKIIILGILLVMVWLSGCVAMYGNEKQYTEEEDWYFFAGSSEVARIKQDKLAFEKLKAQPVQAARINEQGEIIEIEYNKTVSAGYKGLVVNLDNYSRINIHLDGPEKKRYFLGPGQLEEDYLIPGRYIATAYKGSRLLGAWEFKVSIEQYSYMGRKVHWYVFYDN